MTSLARTWPGDTERVETEVEGKRREGGGCADTAVVSGQSSSTVQCSVIVLLLGLFGISKVVDKEKKAVRLWGKVEGWES